MRPWLSIQVRISIFNVHCSPTDTAPAEKPKRVIPKSEWMNPRCKPKPNRDLYSDSEAYLEADLDAIVAPKKVDKGKARAVNLPNSVTEQELATRIQNYLCLDARYRPSNCSCRIGTIMPTYILYGYLL